VGLEPSIRDIYGLSAPIADERREFEAALATRSSPINIFHINGDEVAQSMAHLSYHGPWTGYKVVYPAWELSRYPKEWASELDRFDEIWAPSRFIYDALRPVCRKPVFHLPLSCEVSLSKFLSRRYFGLAESDYTFLFFFDLRSYVTRKNPRAVIDAYRGLLSRHRYARSSLVLKINGAEQASLASAELNDYVADLRGHVKIIERPMSDNEIKNLIRCCDCFVSLHRSEGFGRGLAEAMFLEKPVIATAYSGNMDFMNDETALLVDYDLVPVGAAEYPFADGQQWADPDIEQATGYMEALFTDPNKGRELGTRARAHLRTSFCYHERGMAYRERIDQLAKLVIHS